MTYRIDRIIPGGFRDHLLRLWEGNDLPTFAGRTPYLFDDKATAERVAQRLAAKYAETMATPHFPAKPITYKVVEIAQITAIDREIKCGHCTLTGLLNDGSTRKLFSFYIDELSFADSDIIGLTEDEANELFRSRDVAYLRS